MPHFAFIMVAMATILLVPVASIVSSLASAVSGRDLCKDKYCGQNARCVDPIKGECACIGKYRTGQPLYECVGFDVLICSLMEDPTGQDFAGFPFKINTACLASITKFSAPITTIFGKVLGSSSCKIDFNKNRAVFEVIADVQESPQGVYYVDRLNVILSLVADNFNVISVTFSFGSSDVTITFKLGIISKSITISRDDKLGCGSRKILTSNIEYTCCHNKNESRWTAFFPHFGNVQISFIPYDLTVGNQIIRPGLSIKTTEENAQFLSGSGFPATYCGDLSFDEEGGAVQHYCSSQGLDTESCAVDVALRSNVPGQNRECQASINAYKALSGFKQKEVLNRCSKILTSKDDRTCAAKNGKTAKSLFSQCVQDVAAGVPVRETVLSSLICPLV